MKIERLSKGKSKKIIIAIITLLFIMGIIYITNSKAKYQVTKSVQIVNGNVSYSPYDFKIMAMYKNDGGEDTPITEIPESGYAIDETKSYCMRGNQKIKGLLKTINGYHTISKLHTNDKCTLYFSKIPTAEDTLANLNLGNSLGTITTVTGPSCGSSNTTCYSGDSKTNNMKQNGIYDTVDDYGKSYVFRGEVDNNWVKFGKVNNQDIWWRIIRINGNGTIRLIYAGTGSSAPVTNTSVTQIGTNAFNSTYGDNRYVGFMYGSSVDTYEHTHTNTIKSTIMSQLETWYGTTNLNTLEAKIDVDTGFCNDRGLSAANHGNYQGPGGGTGTTQTAYAPWDRLLKSGTTDADTIQRPSLKCANPTRDLFTGQNSKGVTTSSGTIVGNKKLKNPIGLITSDEVVLAGGFMYQNNNKYWLYTDQAYWTMSPGYFIDSGAYVFYVYFSGNLNGNLVDNAYFGVRPVINLSADTTFTGTGKSGSPFVPS